MSDRTCLLTRGLIESESRGNVKIKEGRELPMFLAHGPAPELMSGALKNGIPEKLQTLIVEVILLCFMSQTGMC